MRWLSFIIAVAGIASVTAAIADPAIIYDLGGKFDKSFNESAFNGAEAWKAQSGSDYVEFQLKTAKQREDTIRRLANQGNNPVVMAGFSFQMALATVAPEFPGTKFVIIDAIVDEPNVRSVIFNDHEGMFLVGYISGLTTKTNVVGIVGGMESPLIRRFTCGYVQGVKTANPDIKVIQNMTGGTPSAWNDPIKGAALAKAQIAGGADIIAHAAGSTGLGVLQAAADAGIYGIGVDANQNYLYPGSVLTSMIRRVDFAVEKSFADGPDMTPGVLAFGLAEDGVGYALDVFNEDLLSNDTKRAVADMQAQIISGNFVVHNYTDDNRCPAN